MSDREYVVLSAMGTDRPGLTAEVSKFLADCGCNIEDSRMAVLGGEFGIMILLSGAPEAIQALYDTEPELESRTDLRVTLKRTTSPYEHRGVQAVTYQVSGHGLDHEGIVHAVAEALRELGANIVSLSTSTYNAPVTGSPLFRMEATADLPPRVSGAALRERLAEVAAAANLELEAHLAA